MAGMGEKRRKKQQRRKRRKQKASAKRQRRHEPPPLVAHPMPELPRLTREQWDDWVASRGEQATRDRAELLELLELGWASILAGVSMYKNTFGFSPGDSVEIPDEPIAPALEYMQALALSLPATVVSTYPTSGGTYERAFELASSLVFQASMPRRYPPDEADPERAQVLHALSSHAILVRGPGYPHQIEALTQAVLARTHRTDAVDPSFITELMEWLERRIEDRLNMLRPMFSGTLELKTWEEAGAYLFEHVRDSEENRQAFMSWKEAGDPGAVTLAFLETRLVDAVFGIRSDDLDAAFEDRADQARLLLDAWSIEPGELATTTLDYVPAQNPVWERPVVRFSDSWFMPVPSALAFFRWEMIERGLSGDETQLRSYWKARANVLEERVAELMTVVFGESSVYTEAKWTDPRDGQRYETDVLVLFDRWVLIIECKAHASRGPARRGSPDRAKKLGREAFHGAGVQSARLASLLAEGAAIELETGRGAVDLRHHHHQRVERLTVTLDFIGAVASRRELQAALAGGESMEDFAVAMPVTDLEILVDALQVPEQVLHYLHTRPQLESKLLYAGDETDLLAVYLRTRFSSGHLAQGKEAFLNISPMGRMFDAWYLPDPEQAAGPSGRLKNNCFGEGLLAQVRSSGGDGWSLSASILAGVPIEVQHRAEDAVKKLRRRVKKAGDFLTSDELAVLEADWTGREVIVLFVHPDRASRVEVREHVNRAARIALADEGVETAMVIALKETPWDEFAYTMLYLANADAERRPIRE